MRKISYSSLEQDVKVPRFFYSDCAITNLDRLDFNGDEFSARVDGGKIERLVMDNNIFHYLMGLGANTKSRILFYDPGFKKPLTIAGVDDISTKHKIIRNASLSSLYKLAFRPLVSGVLAWFAAWALMIIPVLYLYGATPHKGVTMLETLSIQIGAVVGLLFLAHSTWVTMKISRSSSWALGKISPYTKKEDIKPTTPKHKAFEKPAPELVD